MIYISIDIETTGVDPKNCQILEIGAIIEDSNKLLDYENLPKFHCYINQSNFVGSEYALNLNKNIIEIIKEGKHSNIKDKDQVVTDFANWLFFNGFDPNESGKILITVAGKNFARFDYRFLELLPNWNNLIQVRHRILDPMHNYIDWKNDLVPPSLNDCLNRAGFNKEVSHLALEDAWDIIKLLRKSY